MTRFVSLCSQRSTAGRLSRTLHLFDDKLTCLDDSFVDIGELHLSSAIGQAEGIGSTIPDKQTALKTIIKGVNSTRYDEQSMVKVKGRALGFLALFLRNMTVTDSFSFRECARTILTELNIKHNKTNPFDPNDGTGFSCFLLWEAAQNNDSDAMFNLGHYYQYGEGAQKDMKKQ